MNVQLTELADVDRPGLMVTHVNGCQFVDRCLCVINSRLVAYNSIFTYIMLKSIQMSIKFISTLG